MNAIALFDLDGTLVDSAPDLRAAINRLMAARDLAGFTLTEITAMVGDGVPALVTRALAARGRPFDAASLADFTADYTANAAVLTRAFPGIPEVLETLAAQGWRLAVCTNKPEAAARALLEALGLARHFCAIGGGDSFAVRKPDPEHLRATLRAAGGDFFALRAVMIGDHHNDVAAAAGAGLPCVFALWGYGAREMVGDAVLVETPAALPALLNRLIA